MNYNTALVSRENMSMKTSNSAVPAPSKQQQQHHGKKRNGRRPSQQHHTNSSIPHAQQNKNNSQGGGGAWKVNKRQKFNSGGTNNHHQNPNKSNNNANTSTYASVCKVGSNGNVTTKKRVMQQQQQQQAEQQPMPMDLDPIFPKLNQSDVAHARRIQQRRKTVAMGKNTAGYAAYVAQVPKHQRRIRSMDTPGTPDHTLDIPTKRWQGMIKAWYDYVTLHHITHVFFVCNT